MKDEIIQFNSVISDAFPEYRFYPSILKPSQRKTIWDLSLPSVANTNGIVLHAQDNLNVAPNNIVPEIVLIEDFYINLNINNIVLIHWNHGLSEIYNGPLKLVEFPTHSFDFAQLLANRYDDWKQVTQKTNSINFMCLNGRPRKHRIMVYNYLKTLNINSFISIRGDANTSYSDYDFDNVANYIKLLKLYQSAPVNIVTETLYYESKGILTEKLLQAYASLQLPIIIGHKGAVADARRYGFDTFDDIIDNSFDDLPNDMRWRASIDLNKHILNNEFDYVSLLPRLIKNQQYLLNEHPDFLVSNFHNQVYRLKVS